MKRPWCFDCPLPAKIEDKLSYCPDPEKCPKGRGQKEASKVVTWLLVGLFCVVFGVGGYSIGHTAKEPAVETGTQLASQVTVLYPSTLTYVQQTALEKGTGLAGVDFIYCEKQTGIDALTLMAIAAHESAWGSNEWSRRYNNVMSWGISEADPDRAYYETKTQNVLAAAKGLKRLYLAPGATYYGGDLTLYGINKYYAGDKNWAAGVSAIVKDLESKLTETQRMKRTLIKTGTFQPDVVWDEVHLVVGWTWYKTNNATAVAGR